MTENVRDPDTRDLLVGESALVYCGDFTDDPAVTAGQTLSSPVVTISNGSASLITLGSPTILTADFTVLDRNGNTVDTIAAGKGIKFTVTPGTTKGQCTVTYSALASGGERIGGQVIFRVR